jgi:hypothetical protein
MDEKIGRAESSSKKEEKPKTYFMKVPGWAVLYEDPRTGPKVGLVEDFFSLEEQKSADDKEIERFVMVKCKKGDRRKIGKESGRVIRWDRVTFQVGGITKWGYFATQERTDDEEEAGEPFQYLGEGGYSRGPKLKEGEAAGLQHVFRISKEPVRVGKSGRELKGR